MMTCKDCAYSMEGFFGFSKCQHPKVLNDWELRGVVESNGNACRFFEKRKSDI